MPLQGNTKQKNPNFSITLSRAFINEPPPLHKTFFLIRHGESKWNLAQSKINITGMLDRDHALTEEGINQARELNARWKEAHEENHETGHLSGKSSKNKSAEKVVEETAETQDPAAVSEPIVHVEDVNFATGGEFPL